MLAGAVRPSPRDVKLPAELADRRALVAFEHVWAAVRPTQGRLGGRPRFGPHSCHEHIRLTLVTVHTEDLTILGAAAAALGAGVARHDPAIENVLREFVRSDDVRTETAADVVDEVARLHGLLNLACTDDAVLFHDRLAAPSSCAGPGDVVLSPVEEAAYRRIVDGINAVWSLGWDGEVQC